MHNNVNEVSSREVQLRRELEVLRCRVVVTEALADALVQLRAMLAAVEVEPRGETRESVVSLALTRIEAALETSPEAGHG